MSKKMGSYGGRYQSNFLGLGKNSSENQTNSTVKPERKPL